MNCNNEYPLKGITMAILVTGGAGYIGSHTVFSLLSQGLEIVVLDNYSNSSEQSLFRVQKLANKKLTIIEGDVRDKKLLSDIFKKYNISDVIHFAGLKSVSESIKFPINYYDNNVIGSLNLVEEMLNNNVLNLIFSSSATVYGIPEQIPLTEESKVGATTNAYGTSKLMVEQMLKDICLSHPHFNVTVLRYFNPAGAHPSGLIGEDPNGIPNNLMPFVSQVAIGKLDYVSIFGSDYTTKDGTGVRDYIHVMDLADGHIAALNIKSSNYNYRIFNLGTGTGYSVLDIIQSFEKFSNKKISFRFVQRRPGDVPECWSDPTKAFNELGWKATRTLDDMINDAWQWQLKNPEGFKGN